MKRRGPARIAVAGLKVSLALAILYLVGANVLLSTSLFEDLVDGDPGTLDVHFDRGWTVLPGRLHASGLSIRGRDSNVEWMLRIDEVEFDVSLLGLVRKRFEASRVHGRGVSLRLRQRIDAQDITPERLANLPPIQGLRYVPMRPFRRCTLDEWSDADWHLWTIDLSGVIAEDVREVWIDHTRFEGDAKMTGGFHLKPLRLARVGPVQVELRSGSALAGDVPLATALGGTAEVSVAAFDPRVVEGPALLHDVSVTTGLHMRLPEIANLPLPVPAGSGLTGALDIDRLELRVTDGIVRADSHVEARAARVEMTHGEHAVSAALSLRADVTHADTGDRLDLRAKASDLAVRRSGVRAGVLRAGLVTATGDSRELDLARPAGDLHAVIEANDAELPDMRSLSWYVRKKAPLAVHHGHAWLDLRAEAWLADGRAALGASVRTDTLDVRAGGVRVRGAVSAHASVASLFWKTGRLEDARLSVDINGGSVSMVGVSVAPGAPVAPRVDVGGLHVEVRSERFDPAERRWALDVTASARRVRTEYRGVDLLADARAHVHLHEGRGGLALDGADVQATDISLLRGHEEPATQVQRVAIRASSARFAFGDPLAHLDLAADVVGARIRDVSILDDLLPARATYAFEGDGGRLDAEIALTLEDGVAGGAVTVHGQRIGIRGKALHVRGDVLASAIVSRWDLRDRTLRVDHARVEITRAEGGSRPGQVDFQLGKAVLVASSPRLDLLEPSPRGLVGRLVVEQAEIPHAETLQALLPADGVVAIESGSARVATDVAISSPPSDDPGVVTVELARAGVRLHETHLLGDFRLVARVRGLQADGDSVDLSGSTLAMRDVQVTGASANAAHWQGDLLLRDTTLRFGADPGLDSLLALDARDASALLGIVLRADLPKIFVGLTAMPHLIASTHLTLGARHFLLRDIDAGGGDLSLRGVYGARDHHVTGAFIVAKGPLSVGLGIDDRGAHLKLFGLESWLQRRTRVAIGAVEVPGPAAITAGPK